MSIITAKWAANQAIDTIQNAKTTFLSNVVTDAKYRAPLQSFVDAQTEFAKEMVRVADESIQLVASEVQKLADTSKKK
jgi:hypothetical protein